MNNADPRQQQQANEPGKLSDAELWELARKLQRTASAAAIPIGIQAVRSSTKGSATDSLIGTGGTPRQARGFLMPKNDLYKDEVGDTLLWHLSSRSMPTSKRRLNITLSKDAAIFLKKIALRDEVPEATKARELIEFAMEIEEDAFWSNLADKRMKENKGFISHEKFWNSVHR